MWAAAFASYLIRRMKLGMLIHDSFCCAKLLETYVRLAARMHRM
jgi:hypothetical protein